MAVQISAKPVPARHRVPTAQALQRCQAKVHGSVSLALRPHDRLSEHEFQNAGRRARLMSDELAALRGHRANINEGETVTEEIDWFVSTKRQ